MKTLILSILFLLLWPLSGFSEVLDEHTVLLLNFENDSLVFEGGKLVKVKDLSEKGNDALVNTQGGKGAVNLNIKPSGPPKVVTGKFGDALYFDGSNYLEVVSAKSIEITDQLTLEAWVNPEVLSTGADNMTVLTKDCGYYMVLRNNGFPSNYLYGVEPPGYHLSKSPLKENKWSHVAITYNGKEITLYVDAQVDQKIGAKGNILVSGCGDPQSIGIASEVRIPARGASNQRYFKGTIDELRVSNIARPPDEIKESFQSGLQLSVEPKGKLAVMWGKIKQSETSKRF